ncbi:MAG: hypothetical protein ACK4K0_09755 [Flavobacteriales bacterium]
MVPFHYVGCLCNAFAVGGTLEAASFIIPKGVLLFSMLPVNLERKMVANSLEAPTQVNTAPVTSIDSVATVGGFALRPTPIGTFRFTFANATEAAVNYKIGDETGLIAAVNNLTVVAATSGTVTPAIFNKVCSLGGTAIGIKSVNYEVTVAAQFANNLKQ